MAPCSEMLYKEIAIGLPWHVLVAVRLDDVPPSVLCGRAHVISVGVNGLRGCEKYLICVYATAKRRYSNEV